ncbi:MAG: ABC transporter permease [Clostridium sp.]|nr:ABC transporter permease [Clostridium sp.]
MYNLLKCEFVKLKKSKEFRYIFLGICAISLILMANKIYAMELFLKKMNMQDAVSGINCFRDMVSGKMYIIVLQNIAVIAFICRDFENRFIQGEDLAGYSRFEILTSKVIICFFINAVFTFTYVFICTAGVSIIYGLGEEFTSYLFIKMVMMYLDSVFISCGISSAAIIISYIFKSISISISVWAAVLFSYLAGGTVLGDALQSSEKVQHMLNNSIFELFNMIKMDMLAGDTLYILSMCAVRILVVFMLTYITFRKAELK